MLFYFRKFDLIIIGQFYNYLINSFDDKYIGNVGMIGTDLCLSMFLWLTVSEIFKRG